MASFRRTARLNEVAEKIFENLEEKRFKNAKLSCEEKRELRNILR